MLQILNLKFTIGHFADNHILFFYPAIDIYRLREIFPL